MRHSEGEGQLAQASPLGLLRPDGRARRSVQFGVAASAPARANLPAQNRLGSNEQEASLVVLGSYLGIRSPSLPL
jgi:hypothetical protein